MDKMYTIEFSPWRMPRKFWNFSLYDTCWLRSCDSLNYKYLLMATLPSYSIIMLFASKYNALGSPSLARLLVEGGDLKIKS